MSGSDSGETHARASPPPSPGSPFSRPVRRVTVVGGTHGNECEFLGCVQANVHEFSSNLIAPHHEQDTGVWCIKAIERQREIYHNQGETRVNDDNVNIFEEFPSLAIDTLLGNPVAFSMVRHTGNPFFCVFVFFLLTLFLPPILLSRTNAS